MTSAADYVPYLMQVHYQDENGNELDLNAAIKYDKNNLKIIDPIYHIKKVFDPEYTIIALAQAVRILENRLRVEYAAHALHYDTCADGNCDIIYDLKDAERALKGLI